MSKETTLTPYELRLEMLKMSKDFLERQYDLNRSATMDYWFQMAEMAKQMKGEIPAIPSLGTMPTFEDIMKMAGEMNQFVSGLAKPAIKKD